MNLKDALMKLFRTDSDKPDITVFNAEHEELRERLERKLTDDDLVRQRIADARLRNIQRVEDQRARESR